MRQDAVAALLACAALAACDTMGTGAPGMTRPQVTVLKEVGSVAPEQLVGRWACRELNPYPDQPAVTTLMVFDADGSLASRAILPAGERPEASDILLKMTGDWRVEGDRLIIENTATEATSAAGSNPDVMTSLLNSVMAVFAEDARHESAEIFQLTDLKLVMRGEETEAPVVTCERTAA